MLWLLYLQYQYELVNRKVMHAQNNGTRWADGERQVVIGLKVG